MVELRERDFYDLCYDAWRNGRNPDMVDRDRYDARIAQGYEAEEISWRDCYPNRGESQESEYPEFDQALTEEDTYIYEDAKPLPKKDNNE